MLVVVGSLLTLAPAVAQDAISESSRIEREMIAVLRSDAAPVDKAVACKHLAIHGSSRAVDDLASLLRDPQLASWARIALEAIPDPEAGKALLEATDSLQGILLTGTIHSIGVRRDAAAVESLVRFLQHEDGRVASAAAIALGRIGNTAAVSALSAVLTADVSAIRSAVAEGCVLSAERLLANGDKSAAIQVYDLVRQADVPKQRIMEATRGAILARGEDGLPLLREQLRSGDKRMFQLALSTVREFPGSAIDPVLAEELTQASPDRAALVIQAMSDRRDTVIVPAVLQAARSGPKPVRLSAIEALGRVGDASCLESLLQMAIDPDDDLADASKAALATVPGEPVDTRILALIPAARGRQLALLIELVGERRLAAEEVLFGSVNDPDEDVRHAALVALGATVAAEDLAELITLALVPRRAGDTSVARQALKAACIRMPDRDRCADQLSEALQGASDQNKEVILEIVGAVGGNRALAIVGQAANSDDPLLQDAGSRLLGKWNSVNAAPILLELAATSPQRKYQIRALRGYLGIARKFDMSRQQRADMCRQALESAIRPEEQRLALDVLQLYPGRESLAVAVEATRSSRTRFEAIGAALAIARELGDTSLDVRQLVSDADLDRVSLEIIKAEYGAGTTWMDVTTVVGKHAGELPLVILPSGNYNTVFGGDPLPGVAKQLKIVYRINGKQATETFAENAPILLPVPR
jgi:HEAT repeat protein